MEANYFTILWWFLPYIDMNNTYTWVYMYPTVLKPLPPPSPPYSSGLSQTTSFECPASLIELELDMSFIYGNIHVSMVLFHIVPCSSPTPSKILFFNLCVSCCLAYKLIITVFLNFISVQLLSRVRLFVTP